MDNSTCGAVDGGENRVKKAQQGRRILGISLWVLGLTDQKCKKEPFFFFPFFLGKNLHDSCRGFQVIGEWA